MNRHIPAHSSRCPNTHNVTLVMQVPIGGRRQWTILGNRVFVVPTHWFREDGVRPHCKPHLEPAESCLGCQLGLWVKERPFLAVMHSELQKPKVLELTPESVCLCHALHPEKGH